VVKRYQGDRPKAGDVVRVPWGLDTATGDIVEIQGPPARPHAVVALPVLGARGEVLDQTTVTFPLDSVEVVRTRVIGDKDITPPGMDGWVHMYRVQVG
jgi:hypothetical protein